MPFFIIIFFVLLFLSPYLKGRFSLSLIAIFFAFIIGFRGIRVGADTYAFGKVYESLSRGYSGYPELLYGYLNVWAHKLGLSYSGFLFAINLIFCFCLVKAIRMSSPRPGFSLFCVYGLYFIFYAMNINRQMLAVSIVFLGYAYLSKGSRWTYLLCISAATLIHSSAIIALIALFLPKINLHNKHLVLSCLIFSFMIGAIMSDSIFMSIADSIGGDYAKYLHESSGRNGFRSDGRVLLGVLLAFFWTSLFIFILIHLKRRWRDSIWLKLYFIAIILVNLTMRMELGIRFVLYFTISEPVVFAIFLSHNKLKLKPIAKIVISTYLLIFFAIFLANNSASILPYNNVLLM